MFISKKNNRIQLVRNQYSTKEKRTRATLILSFKINKLGLEFTDLPELVSKKHEIVGIETVLTEVEIQELKIWLDAEKIKNRSDNLQNDWMRLPLVLKRLIDGADELILDDDSFALYSAFSDILSDAVVKKIERDEKKLIAEDRKEAFEMVKVLNAIQ